MRGKQVKAEAEVWRGEDCEGFDEDVGRGFITGEWWVELVSNQGKDKVCQYI